MDCHIDHRLVSFFIAILLAEGVPVADSDSGRVREPLLVKPPGIGKEKRVLRHNDS